VDSIRRVTRRWEGLLFVILIAVVAVNVIGQPNFLELQNQANLFELSLEKSIVVLSMTFVIISGEIDLSVASVMGLSAIVMSWLWQGGTSIEVAAVAGVLTGLACGLFNGVWVAYAGLPSFAVTLAGLIGYRGLGYMLIEDKSVGPLPDTLKGISQQPFIGPFTSAVFIYIALAAVAAILLHFAGFGRYVYAVGNSKDVARFSGVRVARIKMAVFAMSGVVAGLAGVLYAARLGAVRGNTATGYELDIITVVLLGGVSIFGGSGTLLGVLLSTLLVLNLRNGMQLANVSGNMQTAVVGLLLIMSVLVPNLASMLRSRLRRAAPGHATSGPSPGATVPAVK
jgi:rhamnose transport system permease protein